MTRPLDIIRLTIITIAALFGTTACEDDFPADGFGPTGEGEVTLEASVDFRPLSGALSRAAGDAISEIDKIWVLMYSTDGNLVFSTQLNRQDVTISNPDRTDADTGTDFNKAEDKTERATFKLTVPYGHYRVYAAANVGNLEEYSNEVASEKGLKSIRFKWNNSDIASNSQMFGFFSADGDNWGGTEAPVVRIDGSTRKLNAWIKRVASKVTVAFDGSKLRKGVEIYIKSVSIKDIPYSSQLGEGNAVKDTDEPKYAEEHESQSIIFGEGAFEYESAKAWPCVTKEHPAGEPETVSSDHSSTANALYFFENMQGEGDGKEKWQDADGDGKVDFPGANDPENDDFKDNKDGRSLGTYIEVEAYYRAQLFDNSSSGRIVYRFMLGKDTEKDYNAERNHHYKLTLRFNGNANDVDWHIDYTKEPGIYFPVPYYISYLYNESLELPVSVVGNLEGPLHAEISADEELNKTSWGPYQPDAGFDYYKGTVYKPGPWHGFLALRETSDAVVTGSWTWESGKQNNQSFWEDNSRGTRDYSNVPSDKPYDEDTGIGSYTVKKEGDELVYSIPLYTRAKQLITATGYTGNNPYTAYRRKAVITFTATINGKPYTAKAEIIQVERVVNPKGIWRSSTITDPFHVELKVRKKESDKKFININSEGPWTATFEHGSEYFEISADNGTYGTDDVTGVTGSDVQFWVRPKSAIGSNDVRCGMIKVTYHDNSCIHHIFLRQGYDPIDISGNGILWHTKNMYAAEQETESPLEEGSMFKFGNWDDAILAENNIEKGYGVAPGKTYQFKLAGGGSKTWEEIQPCGKNMTKEQVHKNKFSAPTTMGKNVRVAKFSDFKNLYEDKKIDYGYGVLYGDGATATAENEDEAYGYTRGGPASYGMRGCFIYNHDNGNNVFFPIGATGYGHRKNQYDEDVDGGYGGVLRYAARSHVMTAYASNGNVDKRPLFYDVYLSQGAIYFLQEADTKSTLDDLAPNITTAWDVNYRTFDFYSYWFDATSCSGSFGMGKNKGAMNGSDAGFVRCVTDNSGN